ncbi:MAG: hypothetical protein WA374_16530 [Acidobacteriaceae bacterium]
MATAASTLEVELAELRLRLRSTLHDPARPLEAKISEFRTLLLESRRCAAHAQSTVPLLEDSL